MKTTGSMGLRLTVEQADELIAHAKQTLEVLQSECCGVLVGRGDRVERVYRVKNVDYSPYTFTLDGEELLHIQREADSRDWEILGFYHSHLISDALPSKTDIIKASEHWPGFVQVIISLKDPEHPVLRAFRIQDEAFAAEDVILQ